MRRHGKAKGFTLIELMIVVAIIGLIGSIAVYGQRNEQKKRRDVKRVSNINELQKGLALYISENGGYPVMDGCINGSDAVTAALMAGGHISEAAFYDPLNPSDASLCYRYSSTGPTYALTFTLETNASQVYSMGDNTIVP